MRKKSFFLIFVLCAALFLSGCYSKATLEYEPAGAGETTYDGLLPIKSKVVERAWAIKDLNLKPYTKVMFKDAQIQYRPVAPASRETYTWDDRSEFPISEDGQARLQKMLSDTFIKELSKSERFKLVQEAGPDVLMVRVSLLDVISAMPPEPAGRSAIYLESVGEATLVVEFLDSQSKAILARAMDRRAADSPDGKMIKSSSVSSLFEAQQVVSTWAIILRSRLDQVGSSLTSD
jgi:hypothetical protein